MFASLDSVIRKVPHLRGDDALFLVSMMEKFPRVRKGFTNFTSILPLSRIEKAIEVLESQPRSGWDRLGVPHAPSDVRHSHYSASWNKRRIIFEDSGKKGETVLRHSVEAAELYALLFKTEPHLPLAIEVLKFHDFVEAINGDFTPHDPITKNEKSRLERMALNLLTESRESEDLLASHIYNCMQIFEGDLTDFTPARDRMLAATAAARTNQRDPYTAFLRELYSSPLPNLILLKVQAKDIDTVQMGVCGICIIKDEHFTVPRDVALEKMEEFWSHIDRKLTTRECKIFFEELTKHYRSTGQLSGRAAVTSALGITENRLATESLSRLIA